MRNYALLIVCTQDLVTRGGKFVFMYKRCGRRVILNAEGHMMVAPSRIEAWVQQHTIGQVSAHIFTIILHLLLLVVCTTFHCHLLLLIESDRASLTNVMHCNLHGPQHMVDHKPCPCLRLLGLLILAYLSTAVAADLPVCCAVRTWQHHLLANYYHATLAVVLAQFSHKGFTDGMAGVIALAEASPYLQASTRTEQSAPYLHNIVQGCLLYRICLRVKWGCGCHACVSMHGTVCCKATAACPGLTCQRPGFICGKILS